MGPCRSKLMAVLLFVIFVGAAAACAVGCASGDDDQTSGPAAAEHQCICHNMIAPAAAPVVANARPATHQLAIVELLDNSRIVPAEIFNPPRV